MRAGVGGVPRWSDGDPSLAVETRQPRCVYPEVVKDALNVGWRAALGRDPQANAGRNLYARLPFVASPTSAADRWTLRRIADTCSA